MRLGFIGGGNMAYAIAKGVIASELVAPFDITVNDTNEEALLKFKESGTKTTCDLNELLDCDYILLAVKPQILPSVLENIKNDYKDKVFVSIAAGVSVEEIKSLLPFNAKVIRIMPNTPALIGEGMSVLAKATAPVKDDEFKNVEEIFKSIGKTEILDENMINAVTSVSGSSPAYVFIMIEAMADAAVRDGIPRDIAYRLAAQSVLGSAKMVLETSKHPAELKDMVCSPKGTTIEAVAEFEKAGFRNAIVSAMKKCTDKANNM